MATEKFKVFKKTIDILFDDLDTKLESVESAHLLHLTRSALMGMIQRFQFSPSEVKTTLEYLELKAEHFKKIAFRN